MVDYLDKYIEIGPYINWMKLQYIPKHKINYLEFGAKNTQILVCAHGLTRNAHDFDKIASILAKNYRVISISYPGRGNSDYFKNKNHYNYYVYVLDTIKILKKLKIKNPFWLGTSMGGIIGMGISAVTNTKIKGLILNDVGPAFPKIVVEKIKNYAKKELYFDNLINAKNHLKLIYADFGIKKEIDWDYLTKFSFIKNTNQKYLMNYDPEIVRGVKISSKMRKKNIEAWWLWKKIKSKMLVIYGEKSNILLPDILEKMNSIKAFDLYKIPNVGHAPALLEDDQIDFIKNWLDNFSNN